MPLFPGRRGGVAVVEIFGVIGNHVRVPAYSRLLDSIAESKRYRALVLDIDSPGGSASGSELLFHSLKKVAETKPVVAYVRGIGASGAAGLPRRARLVGRILSDSPLADGVPWHRVIGAVGRVSQRRGTGAQEQIDRLLDEGIEFEDGGRIDLGIYLWEP